MDNEKVQKYCETIEDLIDRDFEITVLTNKEFNAINNLLLELTVAGAYTVPDKYIK